VTGIRWAERPGRATGSEDRVFLGDRYAIVLDGASQPETGGRDGGWYASVLGKTLKARLDAAPEARLADVVADAIATVVDSHGLIPAASPSATLSIVRWSDTVTEAFVLGDTPVIVQGSGGQLVHLRDDRLASVAVAERAALRAAVTAGGFGGDHPQQWRNLVDAQRRARNRAGGYWIAEATPDAAYHAELGSWPTNDVDAVLVVTDGVSAGPDRYQVPASWAQAVQTARHDPAALVEMVHTVEATDPHGTRWPRSKRHDDKTAVLVDHTVTATDADPAPRRPPRRDS
jgi:hypothetical protein